MSTLSYYRRGPEEQIICDILADFGCLTELQMVKTIYYKDEDVVKRIIRNLEKRRDVSAESHPGYLSIRPNEPVDDKLIDAYWAFLKYIRDVRPGQFFRCHGGEAQMGFIAEGKTAGGETLYAEFQVIVSSKKESYIVRRVLESNMEELQKDKSECRRYIFVTRTVEDCKACIDVAPKEWLEQPNLVRFAVIDHSQNNPDGTPVLKWAKNNVHG